MNMSNGATKTQIGGCIRLQLNAREMNAIQPENRAQNNSNKLKSSHESRVVFRETEKFLVFVTLGFGCCCCVYFLFSGLSAHSH